MALMVATVLLAGCMGPVSPPTNTHTPDNQRTYPDGAGPDQINFSRLDADDDTVADSSREH
jgi:uncharacterized protein YqjF (DUF2071 family)